MSISEIPVDNPVDKRIYELVDDGSLLSPHTAEHIVTKENGKELKVALAWSAKYWRRVVHLLDESHCRYILSFPQHGHWNFRLYNAAQDKLFEIAEQELLS